MVTPTYISDIRSHYGHGRLLLPGVSAIVLDGAEGRERLLLVRRSDNGCWSLPAGIGEPDEQPADTITREVLEETCVHIRPDRLVLLTTDPPITYANGDICQYLSMAFRCTYLSGEARVGDDESTEVGWFDLTQLPDLSARERRRIACALEPAGPTRFDLSANVADLS